MTELCHGSRAQDRFVTTAALSLVFVVYIRGAVVRTPSCFCRGATSGNKGSIHPSAQNTHCVPPARLQPVFAYQLFNIANVTLFSRLHLSLHCLLKPRDDHVSDMILIKNFLVTTGTHWLALMRFLPMLRVEIGPLFIMNQLFHCPPAHSLKIHLIRTRPPPTPGKEASKL
ncbi:uncharacterized protein EV420DRAFT_385452 [Desarmillaria tabescens]|uniref:Uncharacterized protein n=1 Tax=Armillaria tabescens TaxID=1929756 RepID=A0AA39N5J4_ARMTA|nr:uncharacterized protein EV420DRAFT_385452 [Desarmillaria tabescens]KAK0458209.1 hypothetical protein EV420DRAFT_385452 [Desarmillaria tabescens]